MDSKDPLADLLPFLSAPHLHSSWLSWKCKIQIQRFPGWPSDFSVWFPSPYFLIVLTCPSLTNWSFSTQEKTSMQSKMHIDHHIAQILNMRKHFVQMIVYETDSRLSDKKQSVTSRSREFRSFLDGTGTGKNWSRKKNRSRYRKTYCGAPSLKKCIFETPYWTDSHLDKAMTLNFWSTLELGSCGWRERRRALAAAAAAGVGSRSRFISSRTHSR